MWKKFQFVKGRSSPSSLTGLASNRTRDLGSAFISCSCYLGPCLIGMGTIGCVIALSRAFLDRSFLLFSWLQHDYKFSLSRTGHNPRIVRPPSHLISSLSR